MTKLREIEKGKRVCDELLEDINELEEEKIKLVIKLLKKTHTYRDYGETFYDFNLRLQREILEFIRSYDSKIKTLERKIKVPYQH